MHTGMVVNVARTMDMEANGSGNGNWSVVDDITPTRPSAGDDADAATRAMRLAVTSSRQ
jgi:hypothetical protein